MEYCKTPSSCSKNNYLIFFSSQNAGQNCIGIERLIVHSSQYVELLDMITERVKNLRLGSALHSSNGFISPVDCGAMISADRFAELERVINEAVEDGAELTFGGSQWKHAYLEDGTYFSPTVIGGIHQGMEIAQKERKLSFGFRIGHNLNEILLVFAPVALLMSYDDIEDAIELANGTRYGLGASVFGPDQEECFQVAKRLECGMVSVNDFGVFYVSSCLSAQGLHAFTKPISLQSLIIS